jgi:hypothetical protein
VNNGFIFSDLKLDGKPLTECEMVLECDDAMYRLYLTRFTDCGGFSAMAVEFCSCNADHDDHWAVSDLRVNELFTVTAYHDGIRHLEFNRNEKDMEGYLYYTNMDGLIELLSKVREIEKELCRDCD